MNGLAPGFDYRVRPADGLPRDETAPSAATFLIFLLHLLFFYVIIILKHYPYRAGAVYINRILKSTTQG